MSAMQHLVLFTIDEQRYALPLSSVERVVRAVEVIPVPNAPDVIMGLVNVQGQIVPVVDLRRRFHLPQRALRLSDRLIIARTSRQTVGLVVDVVDSVIECPDGTIVAADQIAHGLEHIAGITTIEDQIVFIQHLHQLLFEEEQALVDTISRNGKGTHE
jgi:purine-binding chemotaxis protein CheW